MDEKKLMHILNRDITEQELYVCKRIIEDFEPELQGLFNYYLDNGKYPEYSYKGWTFEKIEEHTHYDVFRVFIQMNKIMTDEEYCDLFGYMSFGIK